MTTLLKAIKRSFWTTIFVALVSSGCLGFLAIPAVGTQLGPLVCEADETMSYETYSYSSGGESGVEVEYFCEVNGDRRELGFGKLLGFGALVYYLVIFALVWPTSTVLRYRKARNKKRLEERGIPAVARIQSVSQTNMRINDRPVLQLELDIHPEGYPPYSYTHRTAVPEVMIFQLQPGNALSATVDPEDQQNILIDLDEMTVMQDGDEQREDTVDRLRTLKQMLDDGLITPQEYEEKKDDILNDL